MEDNTSANTLFLLVPDGMYTGSSKQRAVFNNMVGFLFVANRVSTWKVPTFSKILNIKVFPNFDFVDGNCGNADIGDNEDGEEINDKDDNFHFILFVMIKNPKKDAEVDSYEREQTRK